MKFYENLYRRHLMDMHIEDWDPVFLSKFSPETYVQNLLTAGINYAMIYFQSHAGLCYFPSKHGDTHRAVAEQPELIRRTVELCRENNIRVCGYYSLIYNTHEHDKHSDWRLKAADGWCEAPAKRRADPIHLYGWLYGVPHPHPAYF